MYINISCTMIVLFDTCHKTALEKVVSTQNLQITAIFDSSWIIYKYIYIYIYIYIYTFIILWCNQIRSIDFE